jgi:hypothetical protein
MEILSSDPENDILSALEFWIQKQELSLLMPDLITQKEWPKIKDVFLKDLKAAHQKTREASSSASGLLSAVINQAYHHAELKISRIEILLKRARMYKSSQKVKAMVTDRQTAYQAPFHNKPQSTSDALIYFSTIEFLKRNKIDKFVFTTHNVKDFSESHQKKLLHPDLHVNGLEIQYFTNIDLTIHTLRKELTTPPKLSGEMQKDYINVFYLGKDIKDLPIIDQVHLALGKYHDQLPYIPIDILIKVFPFKIDTNTDHNYTIHSGYDLSTNNKDLFELLCAINLNAKGKPALTNPEFSNGIKKLDKKLIEICIKLIGNQVATVNLLGHYKTLAKVETTQIGKCDCQSCSLHRFEYLNSLTKVRNQPSDSIRETMKDGYVHYQFGNYATSFRLFYEAHSMAQQKGKSIQAFICLYNLKKLKNHILYYQENRDENLIQLAQEIAAIQASNVILTYSDQSDFVKENIKYLLEERFIRQASQEISETLSQIRQHYHSQLSGGWSDNGNINTLISRFEELDRYLSANFILYHSYDLQTLFDGVLEGLITSFSFSEDAGSKLHSFSDYLLSKIVEHAKTENIFKYMNQLGVRYLKYKKGEKKVWNIEPIIVHYLNSYAELEIVVREKIEGDKHHFNEQKRRILFNLLSIVAIIDLSKKTVNLTVERLLTICEQSDLFRPLDHKYLQGLIHRKGKHIDKLLLVRLLEAAIKDKQFHDEKISSSLSYSISKYHPELIIKDQNTYSLIMEYFLAKCNKCERSHSKSILIDYYTILDGKFQEALSRKIIETLKTDFQGDHFYNFAMVNMIDHNELIEKYLDLFKEPPKKPSVENTFRKRTPALQNLNKVINLFLKFKIPLNHHILQSYRGLTPYYDWLLDMDNFDYKQFKPEWVLQYPTIYYLEKIFKNPNVKTFFKKYFRTNKHPTLSHYYSLYS